MSTYSISLKGEVGDMDMELLALRGVGHVLVGFPMSGTYVGFGL